MRPTQIERGNILPSPRKPTSRATIIPAALTPVTSPAHRPTSLLSAAMRTDSHLPPASPVFIALVDRKSNALYDPDVPSDHLDVSILDMPPGSLIPAQFTLRPLLPAQLPLLPSRLPTLDIRVEPDFSPSADLVLPTDSLTRETKGRIPGLLHSLNVGKGRVLSLEADERYIYAGCQSEVNEVVVFSRHSLQPLYRLLGHMGSVLALLVVKEKGWLISASSAGDVRIWSTYTLQPIYIIHPCDDTSGDIFSLAWDPRGGGTLYFGSQSTAIEWINFSGSTNRDQTASRSSSHHAAASSERPQPDSSAAVSVGSGNSGHHTTDSAHPHDHSRTRKPSLPTQSASVTVPVKVESPKPPTLPHLQTETEAGVKGGLDAHLPESRNERSGRYRPHSFFDNVPGSAARSGTSTPSGCSPGYRKDYTSSSGVSRSSLSRPGSGCGTPRLKDDSSRSVSRRSSMAGALQAPVETFRPDDGREAGAEDGTGAEDPLPISADGGETGPVKVVELEIDSTARIAFAHFGYVYALETFHWPDGRAWLISASGDSDIKIWLLPLPSAPSSSSSSSSSRPVSRTGRVDVNASIDGEISSGPSGPPAPKLIKTFSSLSGAVLSLSVRPSTSLLFAGLQDGEILVYDLESLACVRTIDAHSADVLGLVSVGGERGDLYSTAADGTVLRMNEQFDCTAAWEGHEGAGFAVGVIRAVRDDSDQVEEEQGNVRPGRGGGNEEWELLTAGNDSLVRIWSIGDALQSNGQKKSNGAPAIDGEHAELDTEGDVMLYALSRLIAVPTVSDDAHRESCRQGAHLLKKILTQLGAQSEIISGDPGRNPLVLATFSAVSRAQDGNNDEGKNAERKRVLFYGHYDVQPAQEAEWESDPWKMSGRDGYIYGRGVSDNKGPILAVACAAAALRQRRELDVDVVMLIEGEEEAGSKGFAHAVRKHKSVIGPISAILLSNSTWIGESDPCVVFGMRGVVYANLSVSSDREKDAHSGVNGGMVKEPMFDMIRILESLSSTQKDGINVPGFYDSVAPRTEAEMALLKDVATSSSRSIDDLIATWRQPSISIAHITSSGSSNKTVIPSRVTADVSLRIVPDQDLATIVSSLTAFCRSTFKRLGSPNSFEVNVTHSASWWLANLDSVYFKALEAAVQDVWGRPPLKIREGGTVPTIFWLEKEFGAPCVHLPLGQASDAGHLPNERMRLTNLRNGRRVVERYLGRLGKLRDSP